MGSALDAMCNLSEGDRAVRAKAVDRFIVDATGSVETSCTGFQSTAAETRALSTLTAEFTIGSAVQDSGAQPPGTRSASLAATTVAGILLSY